MFKLITLVFFTILNSLYFLLGFLKNLPIIIGSKKPEKLDAVVVSVGNLSFGGTGKTPFVMALAKSLKAEEKRVAILSRGYKSRKTGEKIKIVSDFRKIRIDDPAVSGDEPLHMARSMPGVAVLVGKDRIAAGKIAVEKLGATHLILDDGFSYKKLFRNVNILLIDVGAPLGLWGRIGYYTFGQDFYTLKRSLLREPRFMLKYADVAVLTRTDEGDANYYRKHIGRYKEQLLFVMTKTAPRYVRIIKEKTEELVSPDTLKGKRVVVVTGIAHPRYFLNQINRLGINRTKKFIFGDHYKYTLNDVDQINEYLKGLRADYVIMTEKDFINLTGHLRFIVPIAIIGIDVDFSEGRRALLNMIENRGKKKNKLTYT
jgi:tetraacyldisaccharide 4'-kinase